MALDYDQSYKSLFQAGLEVPRYVVNSYRWWEDEAMTVMWAFNVAEISLVIRFSLYQMGDLPREMLRRRNASAIDTFLHNLADPREQQLLSTLSHAQRVEEILRRSTVQAQDPVPWGWFPPLPGHGLEPKAIALAIETESHFHFKRIAFEELVRISLGYSAPSVEWFMSQHTAFYCYLKDHLKAYPDEFPLYMEVEKQLHMVSGFIAGPIQQLFRSQPPSLIPILKVFSVLAVRFRRLYVHVPKMNWYTPFDTSIQFLEDFLGSTSTNDLARSMTANDEKDFSRLTYDSLLSEDAYVRQLLANWHNLSIAVWECCSGLPYSIPYLRDCAHTLYSRRNYHSLTAMLEGIHRYSISTAQSRGLNSTHGGMVVVDPVVFQDAVLLRRPDDNYAAYRQHYAVYPGVPFSSPSPREPEVWPGSSPAFARISADHFLRSLSEIIFSGTQDPPFRDR
ncbi:hypothetical protein N7468_009286 [Penicillium chermesinum]|uniref:Uncharacterized protein n=1 Tax=Penicillium chermesinum TaxID=63820 RepID=A0A9W9TEP9_9EURO|nr:uncharacterized protein N7468_009286 [Penicillium chermesinum]KAJ5220082.1 hypothetical protein N7468_009286 [Penicillium chermesinum]